MTNEKNFDIKRKKIQKIKLSSGLEFLYILDRNKIQQSVKKTKLNFQKWKKQEMKYRTISAFLEFITFIMLSYCVAGWTFIKLIPWIVTSCVLFVGVCIIGYILGKIRPIIEATGYDNYRYVLDEITLFGDMQTNEFINIEIVSNKNGLENMVDLKYSFMNDNEEKEKIIKDFTIVKSPNVENPIIVFDRKEYYIPI